jgi:hypothetical protein
MTAAEPIIIKTAAIAAGKHRSQVELPVEPDIEFVVFPKGDGFELRRIEVLSEADAQREYDTNPELQKLLAEAAKSPTVRRRRTYRRGR